MYPGFFFITGDKGKISEIKRGKLEQLLRDLSLAIEEVKNWKSVFYRLSPYKFDTCQC